MRDEWRNEGKLKREVCSSLEVCGTTYNAGTWNNGKTCRCQSPDGGETRRVGNRDQYDADLAHCTMYVQMYVPRHMSGVGSRDSSSHVLQEQYIVTGTVTGTGGGRNAIIDLVRRRTRPWPCPLC